MIKLLWRTDVHMSDKTPISRTDNWRDALCEKLRKVGKMAEGYDAVLDGGDFFDIKSPTRNSHSLVREIIDLHADYPCPVYANVGNHDCVYGDYSFLHQQPLGVLFSSGCFNRLYDEHELILTSASQRGPDNEPPVTVRVVGIPYHGVEYDLDRFTSIKKGKEDYLVVIAHVLASRKGGSMFEGEDIIKYSFLKDLDPDLWCFGHWHKDQGIEEIAPNKWVVNIGSLSRGSLSQDNIERIPCVASLVFTQQGIALEKIPMEVADSSEIFDLEKRQKEEIREDTMNTFVTSLKDSLSEEIDKDLREEVLSLEIPSQIKERALLYLEQTQ